MDVKFPRIYLDDAINMEMARIFSSPPLRDKKNFGEIKRDCIHSALKPEETFHALLEEEDCLVLNSDIFPQENVENLNSKNVQNSTSKNAQNPTSKNIQNPTSRKTYFIEDNQTGIYKFGCSEGSVNKDIQRNSICSSKDIWSNIDLETMKQKGTCAECSNIGEVNESDIKISDLLQNLMRNEVRCRRNWGKTSNQLCFDIIKKKNCVSSIHQCQHEKAADLHDTVDDFPSWNHPCISATSNWKKDVDLSQIAATYGKISSLSLNEQKSSNTIFINEKKKISKKPACSSMLWEVTDGLTVPHHDIKQPQFQFSRPLLGRRNQNDHAVFKGCLFCKCNGEDVSFYETHVLKDCKGNVVCPILWSHHCEICGATGKNAHTKSYCPFSSYANTVTLKKTKRDSSGKKRLPFLSTPDYSLWS